MIYNKDDSLFKKIKDLYTLYFKILDDGHGFKLRQWIPLLRLRVLRSLRWDFIFH